MMFSSIGFIGTGAMGSAVAYAVAHGAPKASLFLSNRTPAKAAALADSINAQISDNETIARTCDLIVLGVKPQGVAAVLRQISPLLAQRKDRFVLASMVAGLDASSLQQLAGCTYPVICIMPNTPVAVGSGVVPYYGLDTTQQELDDFQAMLAPAGLVDPIDATLLNAASGVSGCGPAFCALFIEALADGAVACGLPRAKALTYAAQMVEGTARLMLEENLHPGQLKDRVCSPGGTTIQGVRALESQGLRSAVMEAVIAAYTATLAMKPKGDSSSS